MDKKTEIATKGIKAVLDESTKKLMSDEEKMKKLIAAIMAEPGELGKKHCHLTRIK